MPPESKEEKHMTRKEGRTWEAFQIVMGFLLLVIASLGSWMAITLVSQGERLSTVESAYFTSSDALSESKAQAKELLDIWKEMAVVKKDLAEKADKDDVPSDESIRWMERLDSRVTSIEQQIRRAP